MWTFDMNKCSQCPKITDCPDRLAIYKGLKKILDKVENNEGGARIGVIVLVCKEPELLSRIKE